ncbi:MAG: hypothetical protein ACW967_08440 [Candidatus Hodarchaeales archaeon]|jgi:hypothetical protein
MSKAHSSLTLPLFTRLKLVNSSKSLNLDIQFSLLNDPHPEIRYKLASRFDTNEGILRVLQNDNKRIQKATEHHPLIKEIIRQIESGLLSFTDQKQYMHHWSPAVRIALAKSLNTSSEVLKMMVYDEEIRIRKILASNPHSSIETLKQLARDSSNSVRIKLTERDDLSDEILSLLSEDKSTKVIRQLLFNYGKKLLNNNNSVSTHANKISNSSELNYLDIISLQVLQKAR